MLVNNNNKFIFLRPYYSASSSVEFMLSKSCINKNDIITPISFPEEILRHRKHIYPKNYSSSKLIELLYNLSVKLKRREFIDKILIKGRTLKLKNHDNLEKLLSIKNINQKSFKKISIVRHPYEKALSCAKWVLVKKNYLNLKVVKKLKEEDILKNLKKVYSTRRIDQINNWPIYSYKNKYIIDIMLKYEKLPDFEIILKNHFKNLDTEKINNFKSFNVKPININKIPRRIKSYIQKICFEEFNQFSFKE